MGKERLFKLRNIVEELSDRDIKAKTDLALFELMFKDFPVPVIFWSADLKGKFFSKKLSRGGEWDLIDDEAEDLGTFYKCPVLQKDIDRKWKKVLDGEPVGFMSVSEKTYVWCTMSPKMSGDDVIGVTGLCWDVTSNHEMLQCLSDVKKLTENKSELSEINKIATHGLNKSRLKKLLDGDKNGK